MCWWVGTDLMLVVPVVALTERSSNLLGVPVVKVFFEQLLGSLLKVFLVHLWSRGGYHIGLLLILRVVVGVLRIVGASIIVIHLHQPPPRPLPTSTTYDNRGKSKKSCLHMLLIKGVREYFRNNTGSPPLPKDLETNMVL